MKECQVLVVCSMARVSFSWTVVWVCAGRLSSHPHAVMGVCKGRLRVIHGQHQARAPHHQLMIPIRQLPVQVIRAGSAGKSRTAANVGPRGICTDCDVTVGQVDITIRQDEVRVVILQLTLILMRRKRNRRRRSNF